MNLPNSTQNLQRQILRIQFRSDERHAQLHQLRHQMQKERLPLVQGVRLELELGADQMNGEAFANRGGKFSTLQAIVGGQRRGGQLRESGIGAVFLDG